MNWNNTPVYLKNCIRLIANQAEHNMQNKHPNHV